jgi:hypothetical protein
MPRSVFVSIAEHGWWFEFRMREGEVLTEELFDELCDEAREYGTNGFKVPNATRQMTIYAGDERGLDGGVMAENIMAYHAPTRRAWVVEVGDTIKIPEVPHE